MVVRELTFVIVLYSESKYRVFTPFKASKVRGLGLGRVCDHINCLRNQKPVLVHGIHCAERAWREHCCM